MPLRYDEMNQVRQMVRDEIKRAFGEETPLAKAELKKAIEDSKKEAAAVIAEAKAAAKDAKDAAKEAKNAAKAENLKK